MNINQIIHRQLVNNYPSINKISTDPNIKTELATQCEKGYFNENSLTLRCADEKQFNLLKQLLSGIKDNDSQVVKQQKLKRINEILFTEAEKYSSLFYSDTTEESIGKGNELKEQAIDNIMTELEKYKDNAIMFFRTLGMQISTKDIEKQRQIRCLLFTAIKLVNLQSRNDSLVKNKISLDKLYQLLEKITNNLAIPEKNRAEFIDKLHLSLLSMNIRQNHGKTIKKILYKFPAEFIGVFLGGLASGVAFLFLPIYLLGSCIFGVGYGHEFIKRVRNDRLNGVYSSFGEKECIILFHYSLWTIAGSLLGYINGGFPGALVGAAIGSAVGLFNSGALIGGKYFGDLCRNEISEEDRLDSYTKTAETCIMALYSAQEEVNSLKQIRLLPEWRAVPMLKHIIMNSNKINPSDSTGQFANYLDFLIGI